MLNQLERIALEPTQHVQGLPRFAGPVIGLRAVAVGGVSLQTPGRQPWFHLRGHGRAGLGHAGHHHSPAPVASSGAEICSEAPKTKASRHLWGICPDDVYVDLGTPKIEAIQNIESGFYLSGS